MTENQFRSWLKIKVKNLAFRLERGGRPPSGRNGYRQGVSKLPTIMHDVEWVFREIRGEYKKLKK